MSDTTARPPTAAATLAMLCAWRVSLIPSPIRGMEDTDAVVELREAAELVGLLEALGEARTWQIIRKAMRQPPPAKPRPRPPKPRPVPQSILDAAEFLRRLGDRERLEKFLRTWPEHVEGLVRYWEGLGHE